MRKRIYIYNENTAKNTPEHVNVWLIIVCEIDFGETPAIGSNIAAYQMAFVIFS